MSHTQKTTGPLNFASTLDQLEIWGGVECTVNRVYDVYFDQLARSGHATRKSDLSLFASLGLKCLRQALLWERVAPDGVPDWKWSDEWFAELQRLRLRPIVGLLHHGSGPRYTSLLDPNFPEKFAAYARSCAERYPWIDAYTPINEPLTTARFSGLYGHWYPHSSNRSDFVRILLNQIRGSVLAMREIREVNASAQFISTEDLGKTSATRPLQYQADFENERRWLTVDLLSGRVDSRHAIYRYLADAVGGRELAWFEQNPCPPDIVGLNYYVTSERFLDHRIELYPSHTHGGNERHAYADIETVRVAEAQPAGALKLLEEAWQRSQLPLAITECHLGCTPEEQLRWFNEIFVAVQHARAQRVDIRAVTAWSLLGSYNWQNLLTRDENRYEAGAFSVRGPQPRPTAVANFVAKLCAGQNPDHPVLDRPGWWRRDARLQHGAITTTPAAYSENSYGAARRILLFGETQLLSHAFTQACQRRELPAECMSCDPTDLFDRNRVKTILGDPAPWAVIHTTPFALQAPTEAQLQVLTVLAEECKAKGIALMTFSHDEVFDGKKGIAYVESDRPRPATEIGRLNVVAEQRVLNLYPETLIIRTGPLFGFAGDADFTGEILQALTSGKAIFLANDSIVTPTYVPDLVSAALDLLVDNASGIWHLTNGSAMTWAGFATAVANHAGLDHSSICTTPPMSQRVLALNSERGLLLPTFEDALSRFMGENPEFSRFLSHDHSSCADSISAAIV